MSRVGGRLAYAGYRSISAVARVLPSPVSHGSARAAALGFGALMRRRRAMVARHLKRVDPSLSGRALERAVQGAFDSYARYWVDSFRIPDLSADEIAATFTRVGDEQIPAGLEQGNGVILALPHLGGWEWAGRWVADQGWPISAVVEPLEPPELFEWFAGFRRSLGMNVIPLGPEVGSAVVRALKDNHVLCLLCDRDLQGGGVEVEFFGEKTTMPAGPAFLSLRTGAPLLPTGVYFTDRRDGHHAIVRPALTLPSTGRFRDDVAALTQALAAELEWLIRRAPEQWHLFQPNWPSDPGFAR